MKVTIHQPEHMPWLGFFHKINMTDVFVVLDDVQYRRRYFQNRNKIRTIKGWQWLTVPIHDTGLDMLIKDVKIEKNTKWQKQNLNAIRHSYSKAPFFHTYYDEFSKIYGADYDNLLDLNMVLIRHFLKQLGIEVNIVLSSSIDKIGKKGDMIFSICEYMGADTYISGISGKEYLDQKKFEDAKIKLVFQEFHHPIYKQVYEPFVPCMSVIDLLFNRGPRSLDIINGVDVPVMGGVFA